ncbi:SDR family NAD(P)-dependent oxidoreductase [Reinekea marinisedimentorum]|uniref:NAD(P)-dependent dehydrogenase (Short-subunit alcohol dehydrogenase family) n=1 Tax=Reinekea marinisedimentorum TaxID=230495 RepID=A0A4R3HRD0_9GAMM|nr:SDR family NAD(P)-dependent oxidoreductase [Reinekea marinisedimentorum]TCS35200.1 NAD(P)-dependent dehydrogenase (short-subunit alcohol dehydrogenase family) [Reinekea marinisedimentorum]
MPSVLITGAAKGLGRELAKSFHGYDWDLYLVVRSSESKASLLNEFPNAHIIESDVRSLEHEEKVKNWLDDKSIDVLINNAGLGSKGPNLDTATIEQISSVFETNCLGVFSTVKGAQKALRKSKSALVLNISSRRGSMAMQASGAAKGSGCSYSYRISKAAQNMLTLCLADDLEEFGIKVAAIHPGRLLTNMASRDAHMTPERSAKLISELVVSGKINNRDYLCMETGSLPW